MTQLIFGACGVFGLAVVIITLWVLSLRRVVPTSSVHVVQSAKSTIAYGKAAQSEQNKSGNVYYEFPSWLPLVGVTVKRLPTGIFDRDLKGYEAYDKDRLPFKVDVKAFFRITDFVKASTRIEEIRELEEQLDGIVQGAVRSLLAKEDLEQIMSERNKYGEDFTNSVKPQLDEWGVATVKNIELMDIRDSEKSQVIENIMAKKSSQIEMESKTVVAENFKKQTTATIEAQKAVALEKANSEREVGLRNAEVSQEVGIAEEKSKQEVQEQAKVTAEKEMAVKQVKTVKDAEIEKEATIVNAQANKEKITIDANAQVAKAEADKKAKIFTAEADKQQATLKAEADLTVATNEAKGIELKGKANAEADKLAKIASVQDQVTLAEKIGQNKEYQNFMNTQKQIEVLGEVGKEQARNLGKADIKMFITGGDTQSALGSATNIFNPKGALDISNAIQAFSETPMGAEIMDKVLGTGDAVKAVKTVQQVAGKAKKNTEE